MVITKMAETSAGESNEVEKVSKFLKAIGVEKAILQKFQREKIDKDAVNVMDEEDLIELGLLAKGDRIKLKSFCKSSISSDREEKIAKIRQILGQGKGKKREARPPGIAGGSTAKSAKTATLKFEFGWKHWKPGRGFVQQKKNVGGGTRTFHVPRQASLQECQDIAENLFFPNRMSPVGELGKMITAMGNFSGDFIILMEENGKPFEFSAERYKQYTSLTIPRLYLLTTHEDDDSQNDDVDSLPPAFGDQESLFGPKSTSSSSLPKNDGLIGTSRERLQYFENLEQELRASLDADKAKEKSRAGDESKSVSELTSNKTDSLEILRQVREQRSLPEPNINDPRVKISVRHTTLGIVNRAFGPEGSIQGIYDWVGSLSKESEHFLLATFPSTTLYPDEKIVTVKDTIINMTETTNPVPLAKDEQEVYFPDGRGFEEAYDETVRDEREIDWYQSSRQGTSSSPVSDTDYEVEPVSINPPAQLLADEHNLKNDTKLSLEEKALKYSSNLLSCKIVIVDRHDILKELLALYNDEDILRFQLSMSFLNENAVGDGVLREMYSVFWDSFVARFCEGNRQFAVIPNPSLTDENYEAIGRIITHQLVLTGTFPVQLAEAQIMHALFGQVNDNCLVNSFLQMLPERERQLLSKATKGEGPFPTNDIVDILSEFNASSFPTPSNLPQILKQLSTSELIHKPFFLLGKVRQGMGDFWTDVVKEDIEELYRRTSPNPTNVISSLNFFAVDKKEEQVAGWLVRFLKGASSKLLCHFLRFCTGTDIVLPGKQIQVRFENMSEFAMCPKAKTCFRSLFLAKGYNSFTHFSSNIEYFLSNMSFWDLTD